MRGIFINLKGFQSSSLQQRNCEILRGVEEDEFKELKK